ncbi:MAG: hypothetical protein P0S94_04165 [Simkaniaceae bacterium]|nr:hypothetical protein [Simkaniaceae bacterium]
MGTLHFANLNFEEELATGNATFKHKHYFQLQFLPLLYAKKGDGILVTHLPEIDGPFHLLDEKIPTYSSFEPWGVTPSTNKISQTPFSKEMIKIITSKLFTFQNLPQLPGAKLIENEQELQAWIDGTPQVLKDPFGFSGRGHFHLPIKKKLPKTFPLIGEPWLERERDFSTHWHISSSIDFLGHTHILSTPFGGFHAASTGTPEPFLDKHRNIALPLLEKVQALGYRGPLSIDAFIYNNKHHICEINPRKTFGSLTHHLGKNTTLTYRKGKEGLLPSRLKISPEKTLEFPLQLFITHT